MPSRVTAQSNTLPYIKITSPLPRPNVGTGDPQYKKPLLKLPRISGIARPRVKGGKVKSVEVTLSYSPRDGGSRLYWTGKRWIDEEAKANPLIAQFANGTWSVEKDLPHDADLRTGNYSIEAAAYDAFDDADYATTWVAIDKSPQVTLSIPQEKGFVASLQEISGTIRTFSEAAPIKGRLWMSRRVQKNPPTPEQYATFGIEFLSSWGSEELHQSWSGEQWGPRSSKPLSISFRRIAGSLDLWHWEYQGALPAELQPREGSYSISVEVTDKAGDSARLSSVFYVRQRPLVAVSEPQTLLNSAKIPRTMTRREPSVTGIPAVSGTVRPIPGGIPVSGVDVFLFRRKRQYGARNSIVEKQELWNGIAWVEGPSNVFPAEASLKTEYTPPDKAGEDGRWRVSSPLPPDETLADDKYLIFARALNGTTVTATAVDGVTVYRGPKIRLTSIEEDNINPPDAVSRAISGTIERGVEGVTIAKVSFTLMWSSATGYQFWNGTEWLRPPVKDVSLEARLDAAAADGEPQQWSRDFGLPEMAGVKNESYTLDVQAIDSKGRRYRDSFNFRAGSK